ncbi:GNAT family N-acetyltransferase [Allobaculum mucilyticum]
MIRYEFLKDQNMSAAYDGDTQIGVCQYVVTDQGWAIVHTEVLPEYGGQGIARNLVLMVSDEAEKEGVPVIPVCSYAKKVLG